MIFNQGSLPEESQLLAGSKVQINGNSKCFSDKINEKGK